MAKIIGPKGWHQGRVDHRLMKTSSAPLSYDRDTHSVDACLSKGASVDRCFGKEILRIAPGAVDVTRVAAGSAPLLDAHQGSSINHVLGRISETWFAGASLWGRLVFAQTPNGRLAEGMVARGEIASRSIGYRVDSWEISDDDGNIIDPNSRGWDDSLTYTATKWQLLECSLAPVPADAAASVRSSNLGGRLPPDRDRPAERHVQGQELQDRRPRPAHDDDARCRRIHSPVPHPRAATRLPSHPPLRLVADGGYGRVHVVDWLT
jgi:phage head maturation protease